MRLRAGLIFVCPGITGDIDHPCILLTDDFESEIQVIVNLTDFRNVRGARVDIPIKTDLSPQFQTRERSTVHYAYASRQATQVLNDALGDTRAQFFGVCDASWLDVFRLELFESPDTPPRVITFCEDLDWGI